MSKKLVNELFKKIDALPAFSKVADKAMIAQREKSFKESSADTQGFHDPRFAKQILQMTNFTAFGFSGHKAGFFESDVLMDEDLLRGVMLAYSVQDFMEKELKGYGLQKGELWQHAMNCALSCWMIATKTDYPDLEAAFVAGMMHDIGKVLFDEVLFEEKQKYADMVNQEGLTPVEAEMAIFGIDHAEIGALIAEKWDFSNKIIEAIKYHHQPEKAEKEPDLTTIVHLADFICVNLNLGFMSGISAIMQSLDDRGLSNAG
ncbi:MAG: HDOD domain-containing protein [Firmicutes bacterium]|nr:HDOD domain-containing protein [Bacillota bacterium]